MAMDLNLMTTELENETVIDSETTRSLSENPAAVEEINKYTEENNFQGNGRKCFSFLKNKLDEKDTEDERLGYSKINRFIISGICLIIVIITYITISESGNFAMTDLKYSYAINFRMYISLVILPFEVLFLGIYYLAGYNLIEKIKNIWLDVAIYGIFFGIGCALFAVTLKELSPHFMMIIDSTDLPCDFIFMILFLKYPFNIWKFFAVTIATAAITVSSILMNTYFDNHPRSRQFEDQNMVKGIIFSVLCNFGSVLGDVQLFYFRDRYFSYEHPLMDAALFYALMSPFTAITLICSCAIAGEPFSPPEQTGVWICIFIYSIIDFIGYAVENYLIHMMDPIFLRIGVLFRIPSIFILDYIFRHIFIHTVEIIGATVVTLCIISYGLISWHEEHVKNQNNKILINEMGSNEEGNEGEKGKVKIKEIEDGAGNGSTESITAIL